MMSIRRRLVWATGLTALLVVSAASALVWFAGHRLLRERLDGSLRDLAQAGTRRAVMEHFWLTRWRRDHPDEDPPRAAESWQPFVLFAVDTRTVVHRSPLVDSSIAVRLTQAAVIGSFSTCLLADGTLWRIRTQDAADERPPRPRVHHGQAPPPEEDPLHLAVLFARPLAETQAAERDLALALVVVSLLTAVLCAGAAFAVSHRVLSPITRLCNDIARIRAEDLHERIGTDRTPVELLSVVTCLNEAIGRLEQAFRREQRLTADLAHELRTPLAAIRSELEQAVESGQDPAVVNALAVARTMQDLTERILLLARLEAGVVAVELVTVDLADEIQARWRRLANLPGASRLTMRTEVPLTACLTTDATLLGIVLDNVLGNAVAYADPDTQVTVVWEPADQATSLVVSNACHLPSAIDCELVFQPWWRGDTARTDTGQHAGLGLALVRRLMAVMGGTAEARHDATGGCFHLRMIWPASPTG